MNVDGDSRDDEGRSASFAPLAIAAASVVAVTTAAVMYRRIATRTTSQAVVRAITIGRTSSILQAAWYELLPKSMELFADVAVEGRRSARWSLRGAQRLTAQTVFSERPAEIVWATERGVKPEFAGSLRLRTAPGERGTEAVLSISGVPAAIGGPAAHIALTRFKSLIETGELPSLERNTSGRSQPEKES